MLDLRNWIASKLAFVPVLKIAIPWSEPVSIFNFEVGLLVFIPTATSETSICKLVVPLLLKLKSLLNVVNLN